MSKPPIYRDGDLDRGERECLRRRLLYVVNAFARDVKRYPRAVLASMREIVASGFVPDPSLLRTTVDPDDSFGAESAC